MKNNIPEELLPLIDWWEANGKQTVVFALVAALAIGGYHVVKQWRANQRAEASSALMGAYTSSELEDGVAKFKGAAAGPALRMRLAKKYYDEERFEEALTIYTELEGNAPNGFEDVPLMGKAQCLEALEKYDEALSMFDKFASEKANSYLALSARLGAVRVIAAKGDKKAALDRLDAMKEELKGEADALAQIENTRDLVSRWEKREKRSLFDAADAAAKQLETEQGKAEEKPAEVKKPETKPAEVKPAEAKPAEAKPAEEKSK